MSHRKDAGAGHEVGFYVWRAVAIATTLVSLLASIASWAGDAGPADNPVSEVIVTGVRRSQEDSINIKYRAASIQDSISAEDIGKLPDATDFRLAAAHHRCTDRPLGRGGQLNQHPRLAAGRHLSERRSLPDDRLHRSACSRTSPTSPPNSSRARMSSKSPTADLLNGGITGTVNLRTRRPSDLPQGWTFVGAADAAHGFTSKKYEPEANGLIAYNTANAGACCWAPPIPISP